MKLYRSDAHFPYRKYAAQRQRTPRWRRLLQAHDLWSWVFVIVMLLIFLTLDVIR